MAPHTLYPTAASTVLQRGLSVHFRPPVRLPTDIHCCLLSVDGHRPATALGLSAALVPLTPTSCLYRYYNCQEEGRGNQTLQGKRSGVPGKGQDWPFDPGPLGHKDLLQANALQKVFPLEHLLLHRAASQKVSPLEYLPLCYIHTLHYYLLHALLTTLGSSRSQQVTVRSTCSTCIQAVQSMKLLCLEGSGKPRLLTIRGGSSTCP